jgi:hypothetical protein
MPYGLFRRQPVPPQYEQNLQTKVLPAPTRGIIQSENEAYMLPGGAIVQDNWAPTMRGVKLRGGCLLWCDLHMLDVAGAALWVAVHAYTIGNKALDPQLGTFWICAIAHTSAGGGSTFASDRAAHPTFWTADPTVITRLPVISSFEYLSGANQRMYAGQQTKLFDVTAGSPVLVKSGQTSGNYSAAQLEDANGVDWIVVVNESGDNPLRSKDGITWAVLDGVNLDPNGDGTSNIHGPTGGLPPKLSHVWKYRNRLYFIEPGSMTAWYLGIDSVGGNLNKITLGGAATKGGNLITGATWSIDAGDGTDDKNVFITDQGEVLVFTGSNPADPANWRQEGRYAISPLLGMNAHISVGGDLLMLTVDGIIPLSQAITKEAGQLELAMLTRTIKPLWRADVVARRQWAWTAKKWDEYGALFVTTPGGQPGARRCLLANNVTGAWGKFVGWDATCFLRLRESMFFGTQTGLIMQADRTGADNGAPYVATLVCGWETFGAPSNQFVLHQMRATFHSSAGEPFQPQLDATVDYLVALPPPPTIGPDPGLRDVWNQGKWGPAGSSGHTPSQAERDQYLQWNQASSNIVPVRNTLWVSIGKTGYAHAPIVQVTVGQQAKPEVELVALTATYEPAGVNV